MVKNSKSNKKDITEYCCNGKTFNYENLVREICTFQFWIYFIISVVFLIFLILEYYQLEDEDTQIRYNVKKPDFQPTSRALTFIFAMVFILSAYLSYQQGIVTGDLYSLPLFQFFYFGIYLSLEYLFIYNFNKIFGSDLDSEKRYRPTFVILVLWLILCVYSIIRFLSVCAYTLAFARFIEFLLVSSQTIFLFYFDDANVWLFT